MDGTAPRARGRFAASTKPMAPSSTGANDGPVRRHGRAKLNGGRRGPPGGRRTSSAQVWNSNRRPPAALRVTLCGHGGLDAHLGDARLGSTREGALGCSPDRDEEWAGDGDGISGVPGIRRRPTILAWRLWLLRDHLATGRQLHLQGHCNDHNEPGDLQSTLGCDAHQALVLQVRPVGQLTQPLHGTHCRLPEAVISLT